jgi:ABC-type transport system involved in cytochrome c biogenesis permease subunit
MRRAFGHSESPPTAFVVMMTVMVVVTLAFWATPTALTIYHLRKLNAAGLWRNAGSRRTRG